MGLIIEEWGSSLHYHQSRKKDHGYCLPLDSAQSTLICSLTARGSCQCTERSAEPWFSLPSRATSSAFDVDSVKRQFYLEKWNKWNFLIKNAVEGCGEKLLDVEVRLKWPDRQLALPRQIVQWSCNILRVMLTESESEIKNARCIDRIGGIQWLFTTNRFPSFP